MAGSIAPTKHSAIEVDGTGDKPAALISSVVIVSSYEVYPGASQSWVEVWKALAAEAKCSRGCRQFLLLRDRQSSFRFAVLSEWEDMASFNRFIRETQLMWTERAMARAFRPARCAVFDTVSAVDALVSAPG
jgi:heme-degrading monooxygenase HmoA